MSKTLMLAAVLLLSAAWLQAQSYPQSSSSSTSSQTSAGQSSTSGNQTTVKGCLQGSSGNYTLTADSGTTYQLQGDTSKLSDHVGHEVKIKGTTSGSSSSPSSTTGASSSTTAGSSGAQQTLTVDSVQHVSKTCKSAGK